MSADKPIQRYDNYYYEMDERPEGEFVKYADHLAAIRNARAVVAAALEWKAKRDARPSDPTFRVGAYNAACKALDTALRALESQQ